jgi:hypothetical protein
MINPNIQQSDSRCKTILSLGVIDLDVARAYLRDVEALAREAHTTRDPRILLIALRVLVMQSDTASKLARRLT